jgi:hypothetical protein
VNGSGLDALSPASSANAIFALRRTRGSEENRALTDWRSSASDHRTPRGIERYAGKALTAR